jgi:hypothetical protein
MTQQPELHKSKQQAAQFNGPPRLIFAIDATASRQPTWDKACVLQAEIFNAATAAASGVEVQLIYFRGLDECRASQWFSSSRDLNYAMTRIACVSGITQIGRMLTHARKEADQGNVKGVIYIGDTFEEHVEDMLATATALGLKSIPIFMLQEGDDREAEKAYKMIAHASGGVHLKFDANAPSQMGKLLAAVGAFLATGDMKEIRALAGPRNPRLGAQS